MALALKQQRRAGEVHRLFKARKAMASRSGPGARWGRFLEKATEAFFRRHVRPVRRFPCKPAGASQRNRLVADASTVDLVILLIIGRLIGSQPGQ